MPLAPSSCRTTPSAHRLSRTVTGLQLKQAEVPGDGVERFVCGNLGRSERTGRNRTGLRPAAKVSLDCREPDAYCDPIPAGLHGAACVWFAGSVWHG